MTIRKFLLATGFLLTAITGTLVAQTATLSPYSRFGPGDLIFTGYTHQQAMGGTAIADYGTGRLNFTNPASYGYDTLFVFEFALQGESGSVKQGDVKSKKNNGSLSYLSFGMPLVRDKWGLSFGLIPYSATGYEVQSANVLDSSGVYTSAFEGSGGYNRYFMGTGFRIGKNLSAGVNLSYLFGTVNTSSKVEFSNNTFFNTRYKEENRLADFYYEFGLHWQKNLKNGNNLAFGLSGAPAVNMKTFSTVEWVNYTKSSLGVETVRDTVQYTLDEKGNTILPAYLGFGTQLAKGRKWAVLADFTYQDWSSYKSPSKSDSLANSFRISAGGKFVPDEKSVSYFSRVTYRLGGYYYKTFLDLKDTQLNDIGMSFGFGLPLRKSYQSMISFTFIGGQRGTLDNNLVRENYFRLQFGLTVNEDWFRKKKYD